MCSFMALMALSLAIGGIVQVYFQRILGMDFLTTQGYMNLWYAVFWVSGWGFAVGVVMFLIDFFRLVKARG
jgi:nitric oxide reductase subunit B